MYKEGQKVRTLKKRLKNSMVHLGKNYARRAEKNGGREKSRPPFFDLKKAFASFGNLSINHTLSDKLFYTRDTPSRDLFSFGKIIGNHLFFIHVPSVENGFHELLGNV